MMIKANNRNEGWLLMRGGSPVRKLGGCVAEVDLKPGFESVTGSQTDVYIATVDFACADLVRPNTNAYKTDEAEKANDEEFLDKTIDVTYSFSPAGIRLVPNPTADVVFIETEELANSHVEITDYAGSLVFSKQLPSAKSTPLSVSTLASGAYFVKISTPQKIEIFKLIINR